MQHILNLFFEIDANDDLAKASAEFLIIDLRPKESYETSHIEGSLNIPLDQLNSKLLKSNFVKFRKKAFLLVCSDSESDNETAKHILESQGCEYVRNGGNWKLLQEIINAAKEV